MKLYIESVFDKNTNNLEDAKQIAIQAANRVENTKGTDAAGKIFYFNPEIKKLIIAVGDRAKEAMNIKSNIVAIKDISDLKIGDIPTKFAKYQELVIPSINIEEQKINFTKIIDNTMEQMEKAISMINALDIPNNSSVLDFKGSKVINVSEEPKVIQLRVVKPVFAMFEFMVGGFGYVKSSDPLTILIDGKKLNIVYNNEGKEVSHVVNNTPFDVQVLTKVEKGLLSNQKTDIKDVNGEPVDDSFVSKVIVAGFFDKTTVLSILGHPHKDLSEEAFGYFDGSFKLLSIKELEPTAPFNVAAIRKIGTFDGKTGFKLEKPATDGINVGAVIEEVKLVPNTEIISIEQDAQNKIALVTDEKNANLLKVNFVKNNEVVKSVEIPLRENLSGKRFPVELDINPKTGVLVAKVDKMVKSATISEDDFKGLNLTTLNIGDDNTAKVFNVWYFIGDIADLPVRDSNKNVNTDSAHPAQQQAQGQQGHQGQGRQGQGQQAQSQQGQNTQAGTTEKLTNKEIESLKHMREEEKLARDVYTTLYKKWKTSPFDKIIDSEQNHMNAIKRLLEQYGIEDPAKDTEYKVGEFKTESFQKLYNDLVAAGSKSLNDALVVGCTIEDLDIYDLEKESKEIDNENILKVYSNLTRGSRNHMRAFYSKLKDNGGDYKPQYISQEEFDEIVNSDYERGNRNNGQNGQNGENCDHDQQTQQTQQGQQGQQTQNNQQAQQGQQGQQTQNKQQRGKQ